MSDVTWSLFIPGVVICLLGWTLYWSGVQVIGAVVGIGAGGAAGLLLSEIFGATDPVALGFMAFGAIVGAALGVTLMRAVHYYFFFLVGAALGAPLGIGALTSWPLNRFNWASGGLAGPAAMALGALIGGIIVLRFRRYVLSFIAAAVGTLLIVRSLSYEPRGLIAAPIFVSSLAIQFGLIRRYIPPERFDEVTREKAARSRDKRKTEAKQ